MWDVRAVFCSMALVSFVGIFSNPVFGKSPSNVMTIHHTQQCVTAKGCFEFRDLSAVIRKFPDSIWASRARFLLGTQLIERGNSAGRDFLEPLLHKPSLVADYVQWSIAKAFFIEDKFQQAAVAYRVISQRFPESPLAHRSQYFEGLSWYQLGDCESAEKALMVIFYDYQDHVDMDLSLRPMSGLHLANCYLKAGRTGDAVDVLWRVWTDMPHLLREADAQALGIAFGKLNISTTHASVEQLWRRASSFFDSGLYQKAVDAFTLYLRAATPQSHFHSVDGQINLAISLVKTRRLDKARIVLENATQSSSPDLRPKAYLWLVRTYLRLGAGEELKALSKKISTLSLSPATHVSILYFLGLWQEDQHNVLEARRTYQSAMEIVGADHSDVWMNSVLWQLGWIYFRTGDYVEAVQVFDRIIANSSKHEIQRALYWKANALEHLGKTGDSRVAFLALCGDFPHGYYCQNTRRHLELSPSGKKQLSGLGSVAKGNRDFDRVQEMITLGLLSDVMSILKTFLGNDVFESEQYLAVSQHLQAVGSTHQSLWVIKQRFSDIIQGGHDSVPSLFWDLAYPKTYMPLIQDAIAEDSINPLDPYLVAALIREESAFDVNARSPACALGLMQLIPKTAHRIASFREVRPFDPSNLFDPRLNIQFGVSYFRSLLKRFDGSLVLSIAAYNAGPVAVARWKGELTEMSWDEDGYVSDDEKFVESIPYKETRNYVKRVLQAYREYCRVNETECGQSSLDKQS